MLQFKCWRGEKYKHYVITVPIGSCKSYKLLSKVKPNFQIKTKSKSPCNCISFEHNERNAVTNEAEMCFREHKMLLISNIQLD